jgi:hypothetical protein
MKAWQERLALLVLQAPAAFPAQPKGSIRIQPEFPSIPQSA